MSILTFKVDLFQEVRILSKPSWKEIKTVSNRSILSNFSHKVKVTKIRNRQIPKSTLHFFEIMTKIKLCTFTILVVLCKDRLPDNINIGIRQSFDIGYFHVNIRGWLLVYHIITRIWTTLRLRWWNRIFPVHFDIGSIGWAGLRGFWWIWK